MKIKTIIFSVCSTFTLVACQASNPTYEYYMQNPEKIQAKITTCRNLSYDQQSQDKGCVAAIQASRSVGRLLQEMEVNPQTFGAKIMDFQIDYVKTQEKIQALKKQKDPQNIAKLNTLTEHEKQLAYQINVYRGVVRLVGG